MRSRKDICIHRAAETARIPEFGRSKKLTGWSYTELTDLEEYPNRLYVDINSESSGGWESLPNENPKIMTIFGKGFGNIIRPVKPETMCGTWYPIPTGKSYLVASMPVILQQYPKLRHSC